jgi:hypothetical protein
MVQWDFQGQSGAQECLLKEGVERQEWVIRAAFHQSQRAKDFSLVLNYPSLSGDIKIYIKITQLTTLPP